MTIVGLPPWTDRLLANYQGLTFQHLGQVSLSLSSVEFISVLLEDAPPAGGFWSLHFGSAGFA